MTKYFSTWMGLGVLAGIVLAFVIMAPLHIVSVGIGFGILAGMAYGGGLAGMLVGGLILGATLACVKLRDHYRAKNSNHSAVMVNNSHASITTQLNATAKQNPTTAISESQKPGSLISLVYAFESMLFARDKNNLNSNKTTITESNVTHHTPQK